MSRRIDLNAARAARAEARGDTVEVALGDDVFTLVPELPVDFVTQLESGRFRDAARLLFPAGADVEFERFMAHGLSVEDLTELAMGYTGMTVGESGASQRSSTRNGKRSRPTSKASTR
jgi:hypothetical protein